MSIGIAAKRMRKIAAPILCRGALNKLTGAMAGITSQPDWDPALFTKGHRTRRAWPFI